MSDWPESLQRTITVLNALLPGGLWCVWWLTCVNWANVWPVLARGAWAPLLLLMAMSAAVWARLDPADCHCLGFPMPALWGHFGSVTCLTLIALFCGWLQGLLGWTPPIIAVEPPPLADAHHAGHGHH